MKVVLSEEAAISFELMTKKLKETNAAVRFTPSEFVGFVLRDFHKTYFEKDFEVLLAEFFSVQTYCRQEFKRVGLSSQSYESLLEQALVRAKKIKAKKRREVVPIKESSSPPPGASKALNKTAELIGVENE